LQVNLRVLIPVIPWSFFDWLYPPPGGLRGSIRGSTSPKIYPGKSVNFTWRDSPEMDQASNRYLGHFSTGLVLLPVYFVFYCPSSAPGSLVNPSWCRSRYSVSQHPFMHVDHNSSLFKSPVPQFLRLTHLTQCNPKVPLDSPLITVQKQFANWTS